jgi:ribosomal protein L11 methyltransferase
MSGRIFTPFSIGAFTLIPEGFAEPSPCGLPLVLGKEGAFGSGEHETTASCLELMPNIPGINGCRALDLGSGTGILAIAAARLGAAEIAAIDLEWIAAVSCEKNVQLNDLNDHVFTICGELAAISSRPFDLVMANIYADILLPLADQLVAATRPGGHLLLSGIPLHDKFDIEKRYTALGCTVAKSRIMEDFSTYLLYKPL